MVIQGRRFAQALALSAESWVKARNWMWDFAQLLVELRANLGKRAMKSALRRFFAGIAGPQGTGEAQGVSPWRVAFKTAHLGS